MKPIFYIVSLIPISIVRAVLSTISKTDNIIVIDHGKIVESGNHQKLLDENGLYADMWNKQKHLS